MPSSSFGSLVVMDVAISTVAREQNGHHTSWAQEAHRIPPGADPAVATQNPSRVALVSGIALRRHRNYADGEKDSWCQGQLDGAGRGFLVR